MPAPSRPSLLLVTPILPAETGNGLAMRAGVFLDALARDWAVTLLVIPLAGQATGTTPFVARRAARVASLDLAPHLDPLWALCERLVDPEERANAMAAYPRPALCRYATTPALRAAQQAVADEAFQAVHVMRSYLAPYAAPFLEAGPDRPAPRASLDLDDDEPLAHRRLAALCAARGLLPESRLAAAEAEKYARHEMDWLPRFQRLLACTQDDADQAAARHPGRQTATVPNTVRLPARTGGRLLPFGRHVLFVGNLSYLPNVDGLRHFVLDILPLLRRDLGRGVRLRIAGSAPTPEVLALAERPGIELVADPPDLARHYRWADLAVIPLRAGGGTRIKLLEGFAHGVPVVSTRIGAEGIAAEDGRHLRLADTPEAFADACAAILGDKALAKRLKDNARALVEERYAHAVGVDAIRAALAPEPE